MLEHKDTRYSVDDSRSTGEDKFEMMDVIPAVDILDGEVVRLMQGDYDQVTAYGRSPVAAAQRWLREGARLIHVIDLDGARHGHPDVPTWRSLGTAGIPFQIGGGIRTSAAVESAVAAGARRAILGTAAVWDPEVLAESVTASGEGAVVASIDVKGGRATGAGWLDEGRDREQVIDAALAAGVRQFLVTSVARDGTMKGPDGELIESVKAQANGAYVMAAGGIGTLDHLRQARDAGADGVVMGRAIYERAFSLADALEVGRDL